MTGRAMWVLAVLAAFAATFTPAAAAPDPAPFDALLRQYPYPGATLRDYALTLTPSEDYEKYYFGLRNVASPVDNANAGRYSVAWLEVRRVGTNEVLCDGAFVDADDFYVYKPCHDLRVGHSYVVRIVSSLPADVKLFGFTPNVPY